MASGEVVTDDAIRSYILGRFKLKSAIEAGGQVSKAMIWGAGKHRPPLQDFERVLTAMRTDGTLAFTNGFWWRRSR